MACLCDAYASAYYRRKPVLDDEDYDIDLYTIDPVNAESMDAHGGPLSSPREQLEVSDFSVTSLWVTPDPLTTNISIW